MQRNGCRKAEAMGGCGVKTKWMHTGAPWGFVKSGRAFGQRCEWQGILAVGLVMGIVGAASGAVVREDLWVTNGQVYAAVIQSGILYIGGAFTQVGPCTGSGVPIDPGTGKPRSFMAEVSGGIVEAVTPDGVGGWYIGGDFTTVNRTQRSGIAHIEADGTVADWDPKANRSVASIAVSGATVYVGGSFTSIGGQPRNRIAALDATTGLATGWNPNANARVFALAISGGTVYAGGDFLKVGGLTRNGIAAIDAGTGTPTSWDPNATNPYNHWGMVTTLAVSDGTVYAGGGFVSIGGQPAIASLLSTSTPAALRVGIRMRAIR
jgi:trimeric autotransporter adhesin